MMMGKRNNHAHTHLPAPERFAAEQKRIELKNRIAENPRAKKGRVIANVRNEVHDETFVAMGTDNALAIVAHRFVEIRIRKNIKYIEKTQKNSGTSTQTKLWK